MTKAIVLLSGGIDSTTILAQALHQGKNCLALAFDYNQKHKIELKAAEAVANYFNIPLKIIKMDPPAGSALTTDQPVGRDRNLSLMKKDDICTTYVPGRNTIFLAFAASLAEVENADEILFGPNRDDYNLYCDCRPEYIEAYQQLLTFATATACRTQAPKIVTPLIHLSKNETVALAISLKAPLHLTHSCYDPQCNKPCNHCDACILRKSALAFNHLVD